MSLSVEHRLVTLELELRHETRAREELEAEVHGVRQRLAYYDRMAVKWGAVGMTLLTIGTLVAMGLDKLKDKIAAWWGL